MVWEEPKPGLGWEIRGVSLLVPGLDAKPGLVAVFPGPARGCLSQAGRSALSQRAEGMEGTAGADAPPGDFPLHPGRVLTTSPCWAFPAKTGGGDSFHPALGSGERWMDG